MKKKENKFENRYFRDSVSRHLINAGGELLCAIKGHRVVCADILLSDEEDQDKNLHLELKIVYTKHQFRHVLNVLKHCWYDNGYGIQYLYGTVWCDHGIWLERSEYDGAECWSQRHYPPIPPNLS